MPVSLELLENGHIVFYKIEPPWTALELTSLYPREKTIRDTAPYLVHAMYDIRAVKELPPGALGTRHGAPTLEHKNSGQIALVGSQSLARVIAQTIIRLGHITRAHFFDTDEEALAYLRKVIADEGTPTG
jgi:hypothetical protein